MTVFDYIKQLRDEDELAEFILKNGMFNCNMCNEFSKLIAEDSDIEMNCDKDCFNHCAEWLEGEIDA